MHCQQPATRHRLSGDHARARARALFDCSTNLPDWSVRPYPYVRMGHTYTNLRTIQTDHTHPWRPFLFIAAPSVSPVVAADACPLAASFAFF